MRQLLASISDAWGKFEVKCSGKYFDVVLGPKRRAPAGRHGCPGGCVCAPLPPACARSAQLRCCVA